MSDPAVFTGRAAVRAGILVTGTEVLSGLVTDRNGPWLSERLADLGVDVAMIQVVGDRPEDLAAALAHMRAEGLALIITSGGLGPTADDLTAEVVGAFCGRKMVLDAALEGRIFEIIKPLRSRWPEARLEELRDANRKQAVVPAGATVLEPRGTAPGLIVTPAAGRSGPTVVVLPGPPGELMGMWPEATATGAFRDAVAGATVYRKATMRLYGVPEASISHTLRDAAASGLALERLEITTCLRRGELEITARFEPPAQDEYAALATFVARVHGSHLFSPDGATIDEQVARLLVEGGETIALAESCTGGLLAARLTERPGASAYVRGGAVVYDNAVKSAVLGVDTALISRHGAVSVEVARALADGARARFGASVGVGITGIAGPGGGSAEKPVGLVCFSVTSGGFEVAERAQTLERTLPGDRAAVRDRATTVAMHLIASLLRGEES
ncbi:MAG: competence/damage-inducible protein A [Solirubrobacteraceae bacterium]